MKLRNQIRKYGRKVPVASGAIVLLVSQSASAALPVAVTDAVTAATTDITTAGGLLIGLAATMLGLRWIRGMFFGG